MMSATEALQDLMSNSTPFVPVNDFMHVGDFVDHMKEQSDFPFASQLSFEPLLEHLRARRESAQHLHGALLKPMIEAFEQAQARIEVGESVQELAQEDWASVFGLFFPKHYDDGAMGFVSRPFHDADTLFMSPALAALYQKQTLQIRPQCHFRLQRWEHIHILKAIAMILQVEGGPDLNDVFPQIIELFDEEQQTSRFFRVRLSFDFVRVHRHRDLVLPDSAHLSKLLADPSNHEAWLQAFPPDAFSFEGLIFKHLEDITQQAVLSNLKNKLLENSVAARHADMLELIQQNLRSYFQAPELHTGFMILEDCDGDIPPSSLLRYAFDRSFDPRCEDSPYREVIRKKRFWVAEDLQQWRHLEGHAGQLLQSYRDAGFESLLLIPLQDDYGAIMGIFELAHRRAGHLDGVTPYRLSEFIKLLAQGLARFIREWQDQEQLVIQREFTAIHPAVEWKFREIASNILAARQRGEGRSKEPIRFNHVYALYGQADIVGSSHKRNDAIRQDLMHNLALASETLQKLDDRLDFPLLDVYQQQVQAERRRLEHQFLSTDETQIAKLLRDEVHPTLRQLGRQHHREAAEWVNAYFRRLDDEHEMVYLEKKRFEDSVEKLRTELAHLLETEQERMQKVLPHLFDMHQTDGLDYNIYLGQSLLERQEFSPAYLRSFRLWQLQNMVAITRKVAAMGPTLPMPLTTAQLIFVYSQPLSIRFRMDEKQFDVDGVYNVRYEILKKRVDKAMVRGGKERLTQPGSIAVVYVQETDRKEYLGYLQYLRDAGQIRDQIEELELERNQEQDGLRALRVWVSEED